MLLRLLGFGSDDVVTAIDVDGGGEEAGLVELVDSVVVLLGQQLAEKALDL